MSINRQYYIHRLCYENWPDFLGGVDLRAAPLVLDSSLTILADRSFMKLPNGERADLGTKLEDYVLNPSHWEGRHKARVFDLMLGITLRNQELLGEAILAAAANSDDAQALGDNGHGMVYVLRFPLTSALKTAMI